MDEFSRKSNEISFTVNVLIKKEDSMFVAHCLELDIVAVHHTVEDVQEEIASLISAQIDYAFSNDNTDNLYHPAPIEIWHEFYTCKEQVERKYQIRSEYGKEPGKDKIIPPWLITKTCSPENNPCYA